MNRPSEVKPTQCVFSTLMSDRTAKTLMVAALLILGMGMLRPDKPAWMYPNQYWATKIGWRHCADVVLTGDSRTLMSLSPAEMQKKLTDRRIFNYGFGGNPVPAPAALWLLALAAAPALARRRRR